MPSTIRIAAAFLVLLIGPAASIAAPSNQAQLVRTQLQQYLSNRGKIEHISSIAVSASSNVANPALDVAVGTTTYGGAIPIQPVPLTQIGSNTKAFTAVRILQLEADGKLSIDDPLGKWLPQYPAWKNITIRHLLDMTSGIPTYDDTVPMLRQYAADPYRELAAKQLVAYVYPKVLFAPGKRWYYSNTAYILSQMIIERVSGNSYASEIQQHIFSPLQLTDTFYTNNIYPSDVLARMPAGYFYNHSSDNAPLKPLLARDVKAMSVSWMQGAGAIVATLPDLVRWVRALYRGPLLAPKQRGELLSIVSTKTGRPIAKTSLTDPRGFGLGVAQLTTKGVGTFWFYEGESLGYRTIYAYFPQRDWVITVTLNSAPTTGQDQVGVLVERIAKALKLTAPVALRDASTAFRHRSARNSARVHELMSHAPRERPLSASG